MLFRWVFLHFSIDVPSTIKQSPVHQTIKLTNINTADFKALTSLPGIGATLAGRIINYRQQHGSFKTFDDLLKVKGLTKKVLRQCYFRIAL